MLRGGPNLSSYSSHKSFLAITLVTLELSTINLSRSINLHIGCSDSFATKAGLLSPNNGFSGPRERPLTLLLGGGVFLVLFRVARIVARF